MIETTYFTQAIRLAKSSTDTTLDAEAFWEDLYWIEHSLLSTSNSTLDEQAIDRSCQLGALLYVKCILQELPHSATGSSILIERLREASDRAHMTSDNISLLTWLALVGAMSSKSNRRLWFTVYLHQRTHIGGNLHFDEDLPLSRFLNFRTAFGRLLDNIGNELLNSCSLANFLKSYRNINSSN